MMFDKETLEALAQSVAEHIEKKREEVSPLTSEEVQFIRAFIRQTEIRAERWEKVKTQVLGWGVIGIAGGIGVLLLGAVKTWFQSGAQH